MINALKAIRALIPGLPLITGPKVFAYRVSSASQGIAFAKRTHLFSLSGNHGIHFKRGSIIAVLLFLSNLYVPSPQHRNIERTPTVFYPNGLSFSNSYNIILDYNGLFDCRWGRYLRKRTVFQWYPLVFFAFLSSLFFPFPPFYAGSIVLQ